MQAGGTAGKDVHPGPVQKHQDMPFPLHCQKEMWLFISFSNRNRENPLCEAGGGVPYLKRPLSFVPNPFKNEATAEDW